MTTENVEQKEDEVVKAIKESYEAKIAEIKAQAEQDKQNALDEQEKRHIAQIKALMLGSDNKVEAKQSQMHEEESFEDSLLAKLNKQFKLN